MVGGQPPALLVRAVCVVHAVLRPRNKKSKLVKSFLGMKVWFKKSLQQSDSEDEGEEDDGDDVLKQRDDVRALACACNGVR